MARGGEHRIQGAAQGAGQGSHVATIHADWQEYKTPRMGSDRTRETGSWKRAAAGSDQPTSARDRRDSRTGHLSAVPAQAGRTQAEPEVDGHATASGLAGQAES